MNEFDGKEPPTDLLTQLSYLSMFTAVVTLLAEVEITGWVAVNGEFAVVTVAKSKHGGRDHKQIGPIIC